MRHDPLMFPSASEGAKMLLWLLASLVSMDLFVAPGLVLLWTRLQLWLWSSHGWLLLLRW